MQSILSYFWGQGCRCSTSISSKSRHSMHHRKRYHEPSEQASPAEASRTSITSRRQHHQQKPTSPAEAIITSTTSRTRHDKQHWQCRPKPAEPAVPADASISIRASFTSRKLPQNQHHNPKPASLAKPGRDKHHPRNHRHQWKPVLPAENARRTSIKTRSQHQQKTTAEPASQPEASIISKNWQRQASAAEPSSPVEASFTSRKLCRTSINTRRQHH